MSLSAEDHIAIQQLNARFAHTIDAGDAIGWAACFSVDGRFVSPRGVEVAGHDALVTFARSLASAPGAPARRHWVGAIEAEQCGGGATARCYALIVVSGEPPRISSSLRYEDELDRASGGWRFSRRAVLVDPGRPG